VNIKSRCSRKSLVAIGAFVGSLPCVSPHVLLNSCKIHKSHGTVITFERPFSRVSSNVSLKFAWLLIRLLAFGGYTCAVVPLCGSRCVGLSQPVA